MIPVMSDPWRMQIYMLPMRRNEPDAKRHEQATARSEAGRRVGVEKSQRDGKANMARVLDLFQGRLEFKAKQVGARAKISTETARVILNALADRGELTKRREKSTDWFRLPTSADKG